MDITELVPEDLRSIEWATLPDNYPTVQEWVEAMESDQYSHGRSLLHGADGKYCALGVYADLCVRRGIGRWAFNSVWEAFEYIGPSGEASCLVPDRQPVRYLWFVYSDGHFPLGSVAGVNDRFDSYQPVVNAIRNMTAPDGTVINPDMTNIDLTFTDPTQTPIQRSLAFWWHKHNADLTPLTQTC